MADGGAGSEYRFGDFRLDRADERLWDSRGPVRVGHKAFEVLVTLADQPGRLVTKESLFSSVWDGTIVSESALTSVIKELRRALGDTTRTPRFIESVYGRGYRFIAPVESGHADARSAPTSAPAAARSDGAGRPAVVVVSAFNDDAVRDHHPHLAASLREEVLSGLARFREIQLIDDPRAAAPVPGSGPSGRDYQLSATLLPDGDGVKVIARAARLADGRVVWSERMALGQNGLAAGVEKIVRRIIGAALPAVNEDVFVGLAAGSDDFYDRYLIAKRRSFAAGDAAEARRAGAALEALIAERPGFAAAYPPLVRLYNTDWGYTSLGSTGASERAKALALAKAGLAADRGNVHAYTVLGFCYLWHGETDLARNCLRQALELNPYNPARLQEVAAGSMFTGDIADAQALLDRASELNPLLDDAFHEDAGRLKLFEGDYSGACRLLKAIVTGTIWADLYLGIAELHLGIDGAASRIARWRSEIERRWHDVQAPSTGDLLDWIRLHHPLPADAGTRFFADAEAALKAAGEAAPPAR